MTARAMKDQKADADSASIERGLASIVVGVVAAALFVIALGPVLERLYPVPGLNPLEASDELRERVSSLPRMSFILLFAAYALASLIGGTATSLTSGRTLKWPVLTTAFVLMIAGTYGVMAVYQPFWFRAASFLTYPMAYLGHLVARKRR